MRPISYYISETRHLFLHGASSLFMLSPDQAVCHQWLQWASVPESWRLLASKKDRKTTDLILNPKSLTSTVKGTAAEWGWHSCGWFLWFGLHDNLIALHETLTNELLKHLLGCHLHSFLISPEHKGEEGD